MIISEIFWGLLFFLLLISMMTTQQPESVPTGKRLRLVPTEKRLRLVPTEKRLTFVHIGKAAGTSLRQTFTASDYDFRLMHMLFKQKAMFAGPNIVISVRDPIDRFISAYNYKHPKNCIDITTTSPFHCVQQMRCHLPARQ
jgi:hypothetical protein